MVSEPVRLPAIARAIEFIIPWDAFHSRAEQRAPFSESVHSHSNPTNMISPMSLVSVIFLLAAFSRAEDVADPSQGQVHSKRFFGGGWGGMGGFYGGMGLYYNPWLYYWNSLSTIYGYSLFNSYLYGAACGGFFAKATDTGKLARRAVGLDADQLYPRDSPATFSCANEKGESAVFVTKDCLTAAQKMTENKLSTASCGSCALSLVSSAKDRMAPQNLPGEALAKATQGIMKACAQPHGSQHARRSSVDNSNEEQVAMILSKGNQSRC